LNVRSFFKEKYPNRCWGFWHNRKKNRFFYERRNK
jgi:hypothetical protein